VPGLLFVDQGAGLQGAGLMDIVGFGRFIAVYRVGHGI
jgi:hypothetical protein